MIAAYARWESRKPILRKARRRTILSFMPIIRKEYYGDKEAIRFVHEQASSHSAEADLVDALRTTGQTTLSLVAEDSRVVVGHILFTPVSVDGCTLELAALGPVAVLPRMRQHGIGTLLVRTGIYICEEMGVKALLVQGHPDYYMRFGFVPAFHFGLVPSGKPDPDEAFMALELKVGSLEGAAGTVRFAEAFDLA